MIDAAPETSAPLTTVDADNPWPGPEAFREADAKFFFGRERPRDQLTRLVLQNRLVILYGRSGLGKTSLLRAGTFPMLREALSLPVYVRLRFTAPASDLSLGLRRQVKSALEAAATHAHVEGPSFDETATLWEWFYRSDAHFFNERSRRVRPLLVFDQFEEAFTHGRSTAALAAATDQFLDELIDLVRGSVPATVARRFEQDPALALTFAIDRDPCGVLLACRQEFLAELLRLRPRLPTLLDRRFELSGMTLEEAARVVTGPGGHLVESGVDQLIVQFVAAARRSSEDHNTDDTTVDPAILSIFCRGLNDTRRSRQLPRITKDLVTGTQDAIIADFYRRSVADLPPQVHRFIEDQLVTESGYRNSAAVEEALRTDEVTRNAIDLLVERRLLRQEGAGGRARLELTHDVLTDPILQSRNLRRMREREQRAREEAEQARRAAQEAAERARERRELQRQRWLGTVLAILLLISLGLGWQTREANKAAKQSLASARIEQGIGLMVAGRPDRALAYVAQAIRDDPQNETARSLAFDTLLHSSWPLPVSRIRHDGALWAQLDATGANIISVSGDKTARVWRVADGKPLGPVLQHGGAVFVGRFAKAPNTVLTVADDGYARRWDFVRGFEGARYDHQNSPVTAAAIRTSDDLVATGAKDGTLRLWRSGGPLTISAHRDAILDIVFDPMGERVLTGSADTTAAVWDTRTGREMARLRRQRDIIQSVRFSPDAQLVVTASRDGTAVVWQARTGRALATLVHTAAVVSAEFDPDGTRVVTASEDHTAQIWNPRTGNSVGTAFKHDASVRLATFSPEGLRILTVSSDQVTIWNVRDATRAGEPIRLDATAAWASFSADGQRVLTASADGSVVVWDVRGGGAVPATFRVPCDVTAIAFLSAQTGEVAVGCSDGSITVWNGATGKTRQATSNPAWVGLRFMEFHAGTGLLLVVAADTATVWQPARGAVTATMRHGGPIRWATFSPDGQSVATVGADGPARLWDTATGRQLVTVTHGSAVRNVHFDSDGRRMITTADNGTAQVWDARTGTRVGPVFRNSGAADARIGAIGTRVLISRGNRTSLHDAESGDHVADLAEHALFTLFTPQGDAVVTVGRLIQLWDAATGRLTATLSDTSPVLAAEFSRDGLRLLTTHANGSVRVWNAHTGQPQTQALRQEYGSSELATAKLAPDGRRIAVLAVDRTVRLWDVPTGSQPDARVIASLVETITGYKLNERGALERIEEPPRAPRDGRTEIGAASGLGARVRAWALADRGSRTIGPFTDVTVETYIQQQLASENLDAKREAQRLFPWDRRLWTPPLGTAAPSAARGR